MSAMTKYLAGVLSVIAVGVTLIAYSLIMPAAMEKRGVVPVAAAPVQTTRIVEIEPAPRPIVRQQIVERTPRRDWTKTALVIGGSTATGAGVGGIVGGKKGALVGAAIGGGASTLFETTKR